MNKWKILFKNKALYNSIKKHKVYTDKSNKRYLTPLH